MSDPIYVELPPQQTRPSFWKSKRGIALAFFLLLIILAAIFSWWISQGKISSSAARLDALVYTVEPEFSTKIMDIYTQPGTIVATGQPLARVEAATPPPSAEGEGAMSQRNAKNPADKSILERLAEAQKTERDMSAKLAQARSQEEKYKQAMDERVTEHVRSQLAMRSINRQHIGAYEEARRVEQAARTRMESAKSQFEQVSGMRAAIDKELVKIRYEVAKAKRRANIKVDPRPDIAEAKPQTREDFLYAPVNGRVLRVNGVQGEVLDAGQPMFFILPIAKKNESDYWIQAWFPLKDRNRLEPGQKVAVRIANMSSHLTGKVAAISEEAMRAPSGDDEPQAGNARNASKEDSQHYSTDKYIPVKITLDDPELVADVEPGAKAECHIQTRHFPGF